MKKNKEGFWSKYGYAIGMGLTIAVKVINIVDDIDRISRRLEEKKPKSEPKIDPYAKGKANAVCVITDNCTVIDNKTKQQLTAMDIVRQDWFVG